MKYENLKTVLLSFLIVLSAFFTWNIWTFQPQYEQVGNEETVNEVTLGAKLDTRHIVRPDQVVYHHAEGIFGTAGNDELDKIINSISKWKYYDVAILPEKGQDFLDSLAEKEYAEIIFPDVVPIEVYRKVIVFEEDDVPAFEFDRILIESVEGRQEGYIYFYSAKSQNVFQANVSMSAASEFTKIFINEAPAHEKLVSYQAADGRYIYLPAARPNISRYTYYRNPIESEKLKEALFRNPSFVERSTSVEGEEYADEASKMTIDYHTSMIYFVNPLRANESTGSTENLLQKSMDFVNDHSGWTDSYRYAYKNELSRRVIFRMYSNEGYPIFNHLGMSEILEVWGTSELNRYIRPSFHLELPLSQEISSVTLMSGEEAIKLIESRSDIQPDLLNDISIGYRMTGSQNSSLVLLEPGWFYQYDGVWRELTVNGEVD